MSKTILLVDEIMKNVKRLRRLFKFYNEVGRKYPGSKIVYRSGAAYTRERFTRHHLRINRHGLTLDLGCGDGHFRPFIRNFVGIDWALGYLKRFQGQRIWGINQYLPFRPNVFTRIVASETLEHIWERKRVLDECHRVLKPKGTLILTVPYGKGRKSPFIIQTRWETLEKYGIEYSPYIHGHFNEPYTRKLLKASRFTIRIMKKLGTKDKVRFLGVVAKK